MGIEVRRADDRFLTEADGISTRHSFSYGRHYDAANIGFGAISAVNVETLAPGAGYAEHRHADVEIVTWVLQGRLHHDDSVGGGGVIEPGTAQRLSAGSGVAHTEANDSATERLVFVQMMLRSDHDGDPEYAQVQVAAGSGQLLPAVTVHAPASLHVLRLRGDESVHVPASPRCLVHVTAGAVRLDDTVLRRGDEARLTDAGPYDLRAADDGGDVLVWQLETP